MKSETRRWMSMKTPVLLKSIFRSERVKMMESTFAIHTDKSIPDTPDPPDIEPRDGEAY
jgi:hypothetical protein